MRPSRPAQRLAIAFWLQNRFVIFDIQRFAIGDLIVFFLMSCLLPFTNKLPPGGLIGAACVWAVVADYMTG